MFAVDETIGVVLDETWPEVGCPWRACTPWEHVLAAILADHAGPDLVDRTVLVLAEHRDGPSGFVDLDPIDLERVIRRLPASRAKARAVIEAARALVRYHRGEVPTERDRLAVLPGVGRRVADTVMAHAFDQQAPVVDDVVQRVAHRLGWTGHPRDGTAARAVAARFPPQVWARRCHQLMALGRAYCRRSQPRCGACPLRDHCSRQGVLAPR